VQLAGRGAAPVAEACVESVRRGEPGVGPEIDEGGTAASRLPLDEGAEAAAEAAASLVGGDVELPELDAAGLRGGDQADAAGNSARRVGRPRSARFAR
jgi:hypothetical protein